MRGVALAALWLPTSSLFAGLQPRLSTHLASSGCSGVVWRREGAARCLPLTPSRAQIAPVALAGDDPDDEDSLSGAFRLLGLPEDATYGEITDTCEELCEKFASDPMRVEALVAAKDLIVNERLKQRMMGTLKPEVEDSPYDKKPVPWTPPWVIAWAFLKKIFELPDLSHAFQVLTLMLTLVCGAWLSPRSAGTCLMLNVMCGLGFMYNRGLPPVVKDDMGQIGEVRPIKPKPMALTAGITASFWLGGFLKARQLVSSGVVPTWLPELVLRCTFISLGLIVASLLLKPQAVFEP